MKTTEKIILDIAPITKIPLSGSQSFSYLGNQKLNPGTLVSIPLFKRNMEGIVLKNRNDFHRLGNIQLKKIHEVVEENFLDEKQLALAEFLSKYYLSPLGTVLKFFVPKRVKSRKQKAENIKQKILKKIKLTQAQKNAISEITTSHKSKTKKFLLFGPASSGKTEVYIHAIAKLKAQKPDLQFLILLPELTLTPQAIERYSQYFNPEETVVVHSKVSKGQFYANWQKIKLGEAKIIIGSRMSVFSPFRKLGLIIVDEEQDISFKQWDMNPRYDARTVAEKISEIHQCPIVFGSATPRMEDYWKTQDGKYKLLKLPPLLRHNNPVITEIVDMKKERWIKNYSSISKKLRSEIAYVLKNNFQSILFVNRQGMSNFSVCSGCKTILKCPRCDRALIYGNEGFYKCVHCPHKTSVIPQCPKCKGITFRNVGIGTQKVEKEIRDIFPETKIIRADSQTMEKAGAQEKIYRDFSEKKADILIGTQMISKGLDLPDVALVGIIDGDNMLSVPDFRANERAFQNIVQVSGRTGRIGSKIAGTVLIQTFHPENKVLQLAAKRDFEKFYQQETAERKQLAFPPFGKIVKLIFQDYSQRKVDDETSRVYDKLQLKLEKEMKIFEPHNPFLQKIRGRFRKQIILKVTSGRIPDAVEDILKSLPGGWIIDVDPISIL